MACTSGNAAPPPDPQVQSAGTGADDVFVTIQGHFEPSSTEGGPSISPSQYGKTAWGGFS
jgi:hypothetical protein